MSICSTSFEGGEGAGAGAGADVDVDAGADTDMALTFSCSSDFRLFAWSVSPSSAPAATAAPASNQPVTRILLLSRSWASGSSHSGLSLAVHRSRPSLRLGKMMPVPAVPNCAGR